MTPKPKIQYVGQFYIHGSEARAVAQKEKQRKAKTQLPLAKLQQITEIHVEPVALASIGAALVLLVTMLVGAMQLKQDWQEYTRMRDHVDTLTAKNVELTQTYRSSYDLDVIESRARGLGLVDRSEVPTVNITLNPPAPKAEETLLDDIVWFFKGLFA